MNEFLLGAFCLAVAVTIIVLVKVIFGNLKEREDQETFVVEDSNDNSNSSLIETETETLDFSNIMPEKLPQVDNSSNYPSHSAEVDAPPEIFSTPRVSSFSSHIRR
jgi:hypothetical protein